MNEEDKIINNAKSAYFMIFICILFLFVKDNPLLNNEFVKWHAKTAFVLHLLFLLVYIVFISFWLWSHIWVFWLWLNHILASSILIILFWILLFSIYRAHKWKTITIWEILSYKWANKKVDIEENEVVTEEDKLNIILSYIPFIWFVIYAKNRSNKAIRDISKINIIVSLIISLLFIVWNTNLWVLLILFYIIFFVFINLLLVSSNLSKTPDLKKVPTFEELYLLIKVYFIYISTHLRKKDFKWFKEILEVEKQKEINEENERTKELTKAKDIKLSKDLIYIPWINLIFLFFIRSKYKLHIINSLVITLLIILSFVSFWFTNISALALFPIFYGMWYINRLWYKMPFIYNLYFIFEKMFLSIKNMFSKVKKIKNTEQKINLKVSNKTWVIERK